MRKVRPSCTLHYTTHSIKNDYSSSLQQLQLANQKLEGRFSQIEILIERGGSSGAGASTDHTLISTAAGGLSNMRLLSDGLMKYAEEGGRKWSAISVDDWIEAGKRWLIKVCQSPTDGPRYRLCFSGHLTHLLKQSQLQLSDKSLLVAGQGYLGLVKASWILIDVIKRHPQLNLLNASIRYELGLLAEGNYYSNDQSNGS